MKTKKLIGLSGITSIILAAGLAMLILAACNNGYGVFHEIQTEKAQTGTDVFLESTVKAIGEDTANYYAVMAKVFYRPVGGGSWLVLPISSDSDYYCSGFTTNGAGTIYIATSGTDAAAALKGIYSTTDSGATWTRLDGGEFAAKIVDNLFYANGTLFVSTHTDTETDSTFDLYYYNGSDFLTAGLSVLGIPVIGLVHDGSAYWAMTSGTLYTSATPSGFIADLAGGTPSTNETLCGIAVDSTGKIHVTTADGDLYTYATPAWTTNVIQANVKLGVVAEVPVDSAASAYRLMVAKHNASYGYYEYNTTTNTALNGNSSEAVYVPTASSYTTTVYTKPVMAFHYSTAKNTILIGMAAQGTDTYALYSNTYSGSAWSGWTAE
jgi:hypothetical protein